jgi:hypothetical protein
VDSCASIRGRLCGRQHECSWRTSAALSTSAAGRASRLGVTNKCAPHAGFDLSGAPIGKWYFSTSLVRRRPAVRVRPWAPNSIGPFPCIFCLTSSLKRCGKEISAAKRLVAQLLVVMRSPRHQVRLRRDALRSSVGRGLPFEPEDTRVRTVRPWLNVCSNVCRQRAFRQRDEERMWRGTDSDPDSIVDVTTILNAALKPHRRR